MVQNVLALVMGGGQGSRLFPLTAERAKPATPIGGSYRVIDFVLTNVEHSGITQVGVMTQYRSRSLHRHLQQGWVPRFGVASDRFLEVLPAMQGADNNWYSGTADAVSQNMDLITRGKYSVVNVFGGDHVYLMDISQMNSFHLDNNADLTISAIPVEISRAAGEFGVLEVNELGELIGFEEKPQNPKPMPNNPRYCLASMGNYSFNQNVLIKSLLEDQAKEYKPKKERENPLTQSSRDFGYDVIPSLLREGKRVFVYNFGNNIVPGVPLSQRGFWRDIGNIDEIFRVNMELRDTVPGLNLYNPEWRVETFVEMPQPAKTVGYGALDSIVANGAIISKSDVQRAVIGYGVEIKDGSAILDSIVMGHNKIGPKVRISKGIIDRGVEIPEGITIGEDRELDLARGLTVTERGITVVPKGYIFSR